MSNPFDEFNDASLDAKWTYMDNGGGSGSATLSGGECVIPLTYSSGSYALNGIYVDNVAFPIDMYVKFRGLDIIYPSGDGQRVQMLIGAPGDFWAGGNVQIAHKRSGYNERADNGVSGTAVGSPVYDPIYWRIKIITDGTITAWVKFALTDGWALLPPPASPFTLAGQTTCQLLFGTQVIPADTDTTSWYDWIRDIDPTPVVDPTNVVLI